MTDADLVKACEAAAATAERALQWVQDPKNDARVGQERAFLERAIRSQSFRARRLSRSLGSPMCVGVFGPSQAGKSYLVSVLARKGDTLMALFNDPAQPEIDFIKEINPYGEKEATGLVTRFSIHPVTTPPGFPVALRLLTQTDVLKIIANSYFFDGDQQEEQPLSSEDVNAHIARFEPKVAPSYVDVLREEDIWDVEEYFQRQLRRTEAKVFNPFWERLARTAPRLALKERAELFSILWGRHQPLTDLFRTLLESLAKIGFAEEAFCPIKALVPAATSILNVETLGGLGQPDADKLQVSVPGQAPVDLPRPVLTALAAELRMVMKEKPWDFFDHTDLLDFPGYRGRTAHNLSKYLAEAKGSALKELFLRGKVDYLFQRYTAEQELTSMLLCLRPSNLDVTTLPAVIEEWIGVTHGRTPQERQGRPILLFFLLTMFDQHLAEKAGDEGVDPGVRFSSRLEASLLKPFAKVAESWPLNWTPGSPFQNCFWIRNPNYKAEGIIQYDGRREIEILPHKVARIAELRAAYARVPEVMRHFRDPLKAFDEVMKLNDGGIGYLADSLSGVCKPGMKQAQIRARLDALNRRLVETLAPHFISTDAGTRLEERKAVARQVVDDLDECISRQSFGTLLRSLCLDRAQLADALYEARTRGTPNGHLASEAAPAQASRPKRSAFLDLDPGAASSAPPPAPIAPVPSGRDGRTAHMARTAMQVWSQSIHELLDDRTFLQSLGIVPASLKELVIELIATSRRQGLEGRIGNALAAISHMETPEQATAKATIVAERQINRFVTSLSVEGPGRPQPAFDATGITEQPVNFQQEYVMAWLRTFYAQVQANAQSGDGLIHDPEQNSKLGRILEDLKSSRA